MDAAVFDIDSSALLFRAAGESRVKSRATPAAAKRKLRLRREEGFSKATDELIAALDGVLDEFVEQARTGTVRGRGTPAVKITTDPSFSESGGIGAGSAGAWEVLVLLVVGAGVAVLRLR
jgi:rhombotail lipoprotein